ncbi:hypothetical protein V6D40_02245 [Corynebacterium sp. Q4381]|uniref:hypothetical protein n=1 Tax=Corynebacterium sp. Marseille-Q4381 TaxID=3121597 RepID=UPI002FE559D9
MSHNQRGIGLFMVAGSVLAVVIGLAVWNTSTPQRSVTAGYTQEADEAVGSAAYVSSPQRTPAPPQTQPRPGKTESSRSAAPKPSSKRRRTADAGYDPTAPAGGTGDEAAIQAAPAPGRYRMEDDPLAPPHAVTSQPPTVGPTTHYRPTNARPAEQQVTTAPEQPSAPRATAPTPASQPPSTSVPETQSPQTSQPAQPTQPTEPSRTDAPTTPATSPVEPTSAPQEPGDKKTLTSGEAQPSAEASSVEEPAATPASEAPSDAESDADEENLGGLLPS